MGIESIRPGVWMAVLVLATLALTFGATAWAYLRRPAWAGLPADDAGRDPRRWLLVLYLAVFAATLAIGVLRVVPAWWMQNDEERDGIIAALCGRGLGCPVVGNEMNRLRVPLGPLNRYLMTLCWWVTPDPRLMLGAVLALHAAAAAWVAKITDEVAGAPAGLVAGIVFGTTTALLDVIVQPSNGSWVALSLVGTLWGTLRWVRGDGAVPFVAMVTFLACAVQFHGTAFLFAPVVLLAGLVWRPPTPRRGVIAALVVLLLVGAPWIRYQLETGLSVFRVLSVRWVAAPGGVGGHAGPPLALAGLPPTLAFGLVPVWSLGPLVLGLLVAGMAALGAGAVAPTSRREGRAALLFLLVPLCAATLGSALTPGNWASRYNVPFLPAAAVVAGASLAWLSRRAPRAAWGAALALVAVILVGQKPVRTGPYALHRGIEQMHLAENIEAMRALAARGYRPQDVEPRVHGTSWQRWNGSHFYLASWLMGRREGAAPAEHVLVTACPIPDGFARWRQPLQHSGVARRALVGYLPALAPARLEFALGGQRWVQDGAVPFYFQHANPSDLALHRRLDPALGRPGAYDMLPTLWNPAPPSSRRAWVRTTLAPGADDRPLTLLAPERTSPVLTVNGRALTPLGRQPGMGETKWWYVVPAALRGAAPARVEVALNLAEESMFPSRIDLYEDPSPMCAAR
ncbi:MAG: hypothetical protein U0325_06550 [Polyangiales bacterium]